jgi:3-hydroxyacyl-[acyl-carrier-protein] dehydratase
VPDTLTHALSLLPHGPEFRFVDRLLQLEPGRQGTGEYTVREDLELLRGHFLGHPLFPGVLLIEAAAQLAGIVAQSDPHLNPLPGLKLTGLRNIKILGSARPGATIQIQARITGRLGNLIQAEAVVSLEGQVLLQGALALSGESPT